MFFALTLVLGGCGTSPNSVNEESMVKLLADAMIMEAGHQVQYNFGILPDSIWIKDYTFLCKKYHIEYSDFVKQLSWYQDKPEEYSLLMEKVITHLQQGDPRFNASNRQRRPLPNSIQEKAQQVLETAVEKGMDSSMGKLTPVVLDKERKR